LFEPWKHEEEYNLSTLSKKPDLKFLHFLPCSIETFKYLRAKCTLIHILCFLFHCK
jgi:hypothetical protein